MIKYLEIYKQYLLVEKGLSITSVNSYIIDIKQFYKITSLEDINVYLSHLYNENYKSSSVNKKIVSLKKYYDFLFLNKIIKQNPFVNIDRPKAINSLPVFLSLNEIKRLLDSPNENEILDKAILEMLYAGGFRVSELINLKVNDVNLPEKMVKCFGKGSKHRYVPIGEYALFYLQEYLKHKETQNNFVSNKFVFLNKKNTPLNRQMIYHMVKKHALRANINKNVTPHTIRHSFATHLLDNGANLREVQLLLGHEDIITTQIYTHLTTNKLKADYDKYFKEKVEKNV